MKQGGWSLVAILLGLGGLDKAFDDLQTEGVWTISLLIFILILSMVIWSIIYWKLGSLCYINKIPDRSAKIAVAIRTLSFLRNLFLFAYLIDLGMVVFYSMTYGSQPYVEYSVTGYLFELIGGHLIPSIEGTSLLVVGGVSEIIRRLLIHLNRVEEELEDVV